MWDLFPDKGSNPCPLLGTMREVPSSNSLIMGNKVQAGSMGFPKF